VKVVFRIAQVESRDGKLSAVKDHDLVAEV
jgi:hypothetical protein